MQFFQSSLSASAHPASGRRENFAKVKPKIHLRKSNFIFFQNFFSLHRTFSLRRLFFQNLCPSFAGAKLHLLRTPAKLFDNFFQRNFYSHPQHTINQRENKSALQQKQKRPARHHHHTGRHILAYNITTPQLSPQSMS